MPNSLGTLSSSLVTLRMFEFLRFQFGPIFRAVSRDFSADAAKLNQQIISRVASVPTVADYSTADGYVSTDATTTDVPVTINRHRHVTMEFNINELTSTDRNLVDEQVGPAAYAIGLDLVTSLMALITPANFANFTVETVANTQRSTLGKLRKALNLRGVSPMGRLSVFNSDAFEKLTDDQRIVSADFNAGNGQVNRAIGFLSNVGGFENVFEWPQLPTANSLTGFAGTADALLVAARVPRDPAALVPGLTMAGEVDVVTDPETGLSVQVRRWYDMQKGKLFFSIVLMYGVAVGVAANGQRVVHTAP
jgi:hypothetical protein